MEVEDRLSFLSALLQTIDSTPKKELYDIWTCTIIRNNSWFSPRESLLSAIQGAGPIILTLGGYIAIEKVTRAIQDVGRWWP
jgi:hypothetical protein